MKILFVTAKYPPYIGGAQTQTQIVARHIAKSNEVYVAIITDETEHHGYITQRLIRFGSFLGLDQTSMECLNVEKRNFLDERIHVSTIGMSLIEKARIVATRGTQSRDIAMDHLTKMMNGVDVVHCVKPDWLGFIAKEAAEKSGVPFAIAPYIHEASIKDKYTRLLKNSDIVFALSDADRRRLIDFGVNSDQIRMMGVVPLIKLGGNGRKFRSVHELSDSPIILFIGRIVAYKGVNAILQATQLVWARHPTAKFLFIGPESDDTRVSQGTFDERIRYLGCVSEDEKADALAACDLLCMPSTYEILPSVYLEAWCYAKPVIGGPAYGMKELIEDRGGGLVSTQEPESIAGAIIQLLDNDHLRDKMGQAGKAFVSNTYSIECVSSRMLDAYEAIASKRRRTIQESEPFLPVAQ